MRICCKCGKAVLEEGYVYEGGEKYYCDMPCLNEDFTPEEWDELYIDGGDNYYTMWHTVEFESCTAYIELDIEKVRDLLKVLGWGDLEDFALNYTYDQARQLKKLIKLNA
ncbi:hypothetical protein [Clostridium sp.]|uniref:hypothetical protein n=1 Tax=Clostridium sp. TaxID=1506 RepID=UPI003F3C98EC